MTKVKTTFICQNCGAQSAQWMGKCNSCGEWNTIAEEVISKPKSSQAKLLILVLILWLIFLATTYLSMILLSMNYHQNQTSCLKGDIKIYHL